jgi:integrase
MGVFERPKKSGVWWISYYDDKRVKRREKVGRRAAALERLVERKKEIRERTYVPPRDRARSLSFRTLAGEALERKRLRSRPRSQQTDRERLGILLPLLGELEAGQIKPDGIEQALAELRERRGISLSTLNRYRALLSTIFAFGVKSKGLLANPVSRVKKFPENANRVRYLLPDEERRIREVIWTSCPHREPELDLALNTGMRRGEQFGLKWRDVALDVGIAYANGKTGPRQVVINAVAAAALERLRQAQAAEASEYVCPEAKRDDQRDERRWFAKVVKQAGVKNFRWHDLRHTFASRLVVRGAELIAVKELLGHKSLAMTMRYSHLSKSHIRDAAEKLCEKAKEGGSSS